MKVNWDKRFLELAQHVATWSKDRSRGVGAVIVNDDNRPVSFGFNGFPSGADDEKEDRHERPLKYDWTVHAEENAIANAARIGVSTKDCTMYLNLFPCARCAGNVINAGIKRVVVSKTPNYDDSKYGNEFRISKEKLIECGVEIDIIEDKIIFNIEVGTGSPEKDKETIKQLRKKYREEYEIESILNAYTIIIDREEYKIREKYLNGEEIKKIANVRNEFTLFSIKNNSEHIVLDHEIVDISQETNQKFKTILIYGN